MRARANGRDGARNRLFGIIVQMHADLLFGKVGGDLCHDLGNLIGQCSPIGIAQHEPPRPAVISRAQTRQRIGWVGLIPIKKMFSVIKCLTQSRLNRRNAVANHGQVL